ncbi:MAG: lamin tail domain-containing protein [Poseidonia sp.]
MKNTLTASSLILLFLLSLTSPMATTLAEVSSPTRAGRSTACSGYVCINEVIPNPAGYDNATYPGGEWFELYNSGTVAVDLTGWKVTTSASKTLDFNANTIVGYQAGNSSTWTISPGDYMVIARNGDSNFYMTNGGMSMTWWTTTTTTSIRQPGDRSCPGRVTNKTPAAPQRTGLPPPTPRLATSTRPQEATP